jgi:hypothetical protein
MVGGWRLRCRRGRRAGSDLPLRFHPATVTGAAGDGAAAARFARLHRYSVWLNAAQLLAAATVLVRLGLDRAA